MLPTGPASAIPRDRAGTGGRSAGEGTLAGACVDSGRRETSPGRPAGSRPPAPLSPPQDPALLCPALGRARRSRGRKRKASSAFLFFNRVNRSKKKKKKKSPKTSPGPATVPATHLRAVPGGGGVHARPEFPTPRSALPSPGGGGCSGEPPARPPSCLRVAVEGAAPARALGTRPRRRARAAPLPAAGLGSRRCPQAGGEQAALLRGTHERALCLPAPCVSGWGLRPRSPVGSGSRADLSPTRLLIAGLGLPSGLGAEVT